MTEQLRLPGAEDHRLVVPVLFGEKPLDPRRHEVRPGLWRQFEREGDVVVATYYDGKDEELSDVGFLLIEKVDEHEVRCSGMYVYDCETFSDFIVDRESDPVEAARYLEDVLADHDLRASFL